MVWLLCLLFVSCFFGFSHAGSLQLATATGRSAAGPVAAELEIEDLSSMPSLTLNDLTFTATGDASVTELDNGVVETVWTGTAGPFFCILHQRTNGMLAGQLTTPTQTIELFSDSTGMLFATAQEWSALPTMTTSSARDRELLPADQQLSGLLQRKEPRESRRRELQSVTVIKAMVVILNRAACEQGMSVKLFVSTRISNLSQLL